MTVYNPEKFHQEYEAGKLALERGQYRLSIKHLEAAQGLVSSNSRQGGQAQIWLVTAYQATNQISDAIALCEKLITHPNLQTREQAQRILYIIKAPRLERPKEWMSEIPDLADTDQGASRYVTAKKQIAKNLSKQKDLETPPTDSQDNQFIWFALASIAVILAVLALLSKA